jgi:hypothetical protein
MAPPSSGRFPFGPRRHQEGRSANGRDPLSILAPAGGCKTLFGPVPDAGQPAAAYPISFQRLSVLSFANSTPSLLASATFPRRRQFSFSIGVPRRTWPSLLCQAKFPLWSSLYSSHRRDAGDSIACVRPNQQPPGSVRPAVSPPSDVSTRHHGRSGRTHRLQWHSPSQANSSSAGRKHPLGTRAPRQPTASLWGTTPLPYA